MGLVILAFLVIATGVTFTWYGFRSTLAPPRITPKPGIDRTTALAASLAKIGAAKRADWRKVRALEWGIYGRYLTGLDGQPLDENDPCARVKDDPKPKQVAASERDVHVAGRRQVIQNVKAGRNIVVSNEGQSIVVSDSGIVVSDSGNRIVIGDGNIQVNSFKRFG